MDENRDSQAVFLVSAPEAAHLLRISRAHFHALNSSGRLGPVGVKLGRSVRWRTDELRAWVSQGCPPRDRWLAMRRGQV